MNRIAIFNPEHDMALANGDRHFIAPRNIREMGRDLAPLLEFVEGGDLLVWGWDNVIKSHLLRMGVAANLLPSDDALTALRQRSGRASAHHLLTAFLAVHSKGTYAGESILVHNLNYFSHNLGKISPNSLVAIFYKFLDFLKRSLWPVGRITHLYLMPRNIDQLLS